MISQLALSAMKTVERRKETCHVLSNFVDHFCAPLVYNPIPFFFDNGLVHAHDAREGLKREEVCLVFNFDRLPFLLVEVG